MKIKATLSKGISILAILLFTIPAAAKEIDEQVSQEIGKLIEFIENSNCKFN